MQNGAQFRIIRVAAPSARGYENHSRIERFDHDVPLSLPTRCSPSCLRCRCLLLCALDSSGRQARPLCPHDLLSLQYANTHSNTLTPVPVLLSHKHKHTHPSFHWRVGLLAGQGVAGRRGFPVVLCLGLEPEGVQLGAIPPRKLAVRAPIVLAFDSLLLHGLVGQRFLERLLEEGGGLGIALLLATLDAVVVAVLLSAPSRAVPGISMFTGCFASRAVPFKSCVSSELVSKLTSMNGYG